MTDPIRHCESHLRNLLEAASAIGCAMWPSVVDVRTRRFPTGEHVPARVYRLIGAPHGSTLYWDQPMIVAALNLSKITGNDDYAEAVRRYVDAFLHRCVDDHDMFIWGNHAYYDVFDNEVVTFSNGYHELRPITPAWDVFYDRAPEATETYIRAMARRHIYDARTGAFNRHDDGKKGHAFLEAGGILCESIAWLHARTADPELLRSALQVARYSYSRRDPSTGLVPNEPDGARWDSRVCTSEVGLWAGCLLGAWRHTGCDEFVDMAHAAVRAYLEHAWDDDAGRYAGQVRIHDGRPEVPGQSGYWPGRFGDPWTTDQWPTHDYPMALAEACLELTEMVDDPQLHRGVDRWARIAMDTRPTDTADWAYAESYGRCIRYLTRVARRTGNERDLDDARRLAEEARDRLWAHGMVQGYPDGGVYESVDGVGILLLALLEMHTGEPVEMHGLGF